MKYLSVPIVCFCLCPVFVGAENVYVSTTGNDSHRGSLGSPFRTVGKAASSVGPGDTVYIRGGEYPIHQNILVSGTEGLPITFRAYSDEQVTFQGSYIPGDMGFDPMTSSDSFYVQGNWLVFKDLVIQNGENGLYVKSNASHNRFERLDMHDNYYSGLVMSQGASYNTIINSDAHDQYDARTYGQHSDGFVLANGVGEGNALIGCRSWGNADDGFDLWKAGNRVTLINSLAYRNGFDNWGIGSAFEGNGNGFKLGVHGPSDHEGHLLIHNKSWGNATRGFDHNDNEIAMTLFRNAAWNNGTTAFKVRDSEHRLIQNIAANPFSNYITSPVIQDNNSWNKARYNVNADILSFDDSLITSARAEDGSIRTDGFLELQEGGGFYDPDVTEMVPEWIGNFVVNNVVDGADFLAWQRGDSPAPMSVEDLVLWQTNFGSHTGSIPVAKGVPEPDAGILLLLGMLFSLIWIRRFHPLRGTC